MEKILRTKFTMKYYYFVFFVISINFLYSQTGGVGINTTTPDKDSDLTLGSNNKGLLINKVSLQSLTSSSPLINHVKGMVVYNTSSSGGLVEGMYYNNGTQWVLLTSIAASNPIIGDDTKDAFSNNNTNSRVELFTKSDGSSLRDTGTEMIIQDDGKMGLGLSTPISLLHLKGNTGTITPLLNLESGNTGSYNALLHGIMPLVTGQSAKLRFGKNLNTNNIAELSFNYNADQSINNYLSLGLWGTSNTLNVTGNKNVGINTSTPSINADLELASNNRGLLLNKVGVSDKNTATPLSANIEGIVVYNNSVNGNKNIFQKGIYYNTGTQWKNVSDFADMNWFNVLDFNAKGDGNTDDGPAIQNAINAAGNSFKNNQKIGVVYFPPGNYRINTGVIINDKVILRGIGMSNWWDGSSQFSVVNTSITPITVNAPGVTIEGFFFSQYQIEPTSSSASSWSPTPYPNYFISVVGDDSTLKDLYFHAVYNAIKIDKTDGGSIGRAEIRNIKGAILNNFLFVDHALDVVKVDNLHLWPGYWAGANQTRYTMNNAILIKLNRADLPFLSNIFGLGFKYGIYFGSSQGTSNGGDANGVKVSNFDCDYCVHALYIASNTSIDAMFTNVHIHGGDDDNAIPFVINSSGSRLKFANVEAVALKKMGIQFSNNASNNNIYFNNTFIAYNKSGSYPNAIYFDSGSNNNSIDLGSGTVLKNDSNVTYTGPFVNNSGTGNSVIKATPMVVN